MQKEASQKGKQGIGWRLSDVDGDIIFGMPPSFYTFVLLLWHNPYTTFSTKCYNQRVTADIEAHRHLKRRLCLL